MRNDFVKDHSLFHSFVNLEGGMIEFMVERNHLGKVLFQLCLRIAKWACTRKRFSNIKIYNILHSWGACLSMGPSKSKRKVAWCPPPLGVLKFNWME